MERIWSLEVGVGPAEHGVYRKGFLYLAPTFRDEFWMVDAESGKILKTFKMPDHVWGHLGLMKPAFTELLSEDM